MIMDVIAIIAMVGGAALMAVGSFGLVRFPDVFTRMHSATKAATVGVIGLTLAASLEASAIGGALILLAIVFSTILWADLSSRYVILVVCVTMAFGSFRPSRPLMIAPPSGNRMIRRRACHLRKTLTPCFLSSTFQSLLKRSKRKTRSSVTYQRL